MAIGGKPDGVYQDEKTTQAIAFAEKFIADPHAITAEDFDCLRTVFSEKEIAALGAFMAFMAGAHRLGVLMDLAPETS
jgi:hypothetical protein